MITFAIIIIYPIITLALGYLIGSWEIKENKRKIEEPTYNEAMGVLKKIVKEEEKPKKKDLGVVPRPTAEDLERRKHPKLVEEEEAWDNDLEQMFKTPYKMGISQ